jgi:hypothetical protein
LLTPIEKEKTMINGITLKDLIRGEGMYGLNISCSDILDINEYGFPVLKEGFDIDTLQDEVTILYRMPNFIYTQREMSDIYFTFKKKSWGEFRDMADKHDATYYAEVTIGSSFVGRINIYLYKEAFQLVEGVRLDMYLDDEDDE